MTHPENDIVSARWNARDALHEAAVDAMTAIVAAAAAEPEVRRFVVDDQHGRIIARARAYALLLRQIGIRESDILSELRRALPAATPGDAGRAEAQDLLAAWCGEAYAAVKPPPARGVRPRPWR